MSLSAMSKLFAIFLLSGLPIAVSLGQVHNSDSLTINPPKTAFFEQTGTKSDSIQPKVNSGFNSLQGGYENKLNELDSVRERLVNDSSIDGATKKIESIQADFRMRSDSLKQAYTG